MLLLSTMIWTVDGRVFFRFFSIWFVSPPMKVHDANCRHDTCKAFRAFAQFFGWKTNFIVLVVNVPSHSYLINYSKLSGSFLLPSLRLWSHSHRFVIVLVAAVKYQSVSIWFSEQSICRRFDCRRFS